MPAVPPIDAHRREVMDIQRRGMDFLQFDLPELKTTDHVAVVDVENAA